MSIRFMAAGNLISKLSFNLHPGLLSLSRLKRREVRCFAADASDSGFPVRYIPKKQSDAKQSKGSGSGDNSAKDIVMPPSSDSHRRGRNALGKQSNIRNQKSSVKLLGYSKHEFNQDPDREHVRPLENVVEELQAHNQSVLSQGRHSSQEIGYTNGALDSKYMKVPKENLQELQIYERGGQGQWCELNEEISCHDGVIDAVYMEASEEVIEEIQISEGPGRGEKGRSEACRTRQGAAKLAIELLAKRAFTVMELRKKLISKHIPPNIVLGLIDDFLDRGLINDGLYAETFSQSRWTSSSWGPRRIKHALLKKGVSGADVEKAVKLVFEDGEDSEQTTNTRLSSSSIEQLYTQACKQWQRGQNVPHETRKARVIRWLQYRGFDWAVVGIILKRLESAHPP